MHIAPVKHTMNLHFSPLSLLSPLRTSIRLFMTPNWVPAGRGTIGKGGGSNRDGIAKQSKKGTIGKGAKASRQWGWNSKAKQSDTIDKEEGLARCYAIFLWVLECLIIWLGNKQEVGVWLCNIFDKSLVCDYNTVRKLIKYTSSAIDKCTKVN